MKKVLPIFLVILISISLASATAVAYGDDVSRYYVDEMKMSIIIPSDWTVLTRDIRADDPRLAASGVTRDELIRMFQEGNIYLWAINFKPEQEYLLEITMTGYNGPYFNELTDSDLLSLIEMNRDSLENSGLDVYSTKIHNTSITKYCVIDVVYVETDSGVKVYARQFQTALDGKWIAVSFRSYNRDFTPSAKIQMEEIVDSVSFDNVTTPTQQTKLSSQGKSKINDETLVFIAALALIPAFIARKKGRSFWGYFFLCFLVTPLVSLVIVLCRSNLIKQAQTERTHYFCTNCKTFSKEWKKVCPRCGERGTMIESDGIVVQSEEEQEEPPVAEEDERDHFPIDGDGEEARQEQLSRETAKEVNEKSEKQKAKPEHPRPNLSFVLLYALQFSTDDGMKEYMKKNVRGLQEEERDRLEKLLAESDEATLRTQAKELLDEISPE